MIYVRNVSFSCLKALSPSSCVRRKISTMMKVVCISEFGPPEVLKMKEIPTPAPANNEILVRVFAAGVNPVDTYIRKGEYAYIPKFPAVLGKEVAGVIDAVGCDVHKFKVGDRVTCCMPKDGGYAEYVTCPEKLAIHLPDKLSFSQGASLYVAYFSAIRALVTKCKVQEGDNVLIHGASGAVGIAGIQIAQMYGCNIVATAGTEAGIKLIKSLGVSKVYNHWNKGYALESYASTNAKGFDAILETCAHLNLGTDLKLLKNGGRICVVGSRGTVEIDGRYLIATEGQIHGIKLFAVTEKEFEEYVAIIHKGVDRGIIVPVVAQEYEMSQVTKAHFLLSQETGAKGKLVLKIS